MSQQLERLRAAYASETLHTLGASRRARAALSKIQADPDFLGASDPQTIALLRTLIAVKRPTRVLEIGTHLGYTSIAIADALSANGHGHLNTVEPEERLVGRAWERAKSAGFEEWVTFLHGRSTDAAIATVMEVAAPFDLVFLDSAHDEETTRQELELLTREPRWLDPEGMLVVHDAAASGPAGGGVRAALDEWYAEARSEFQLLVLEPPVWPTGPGVALILSR